MRRISYASILRQRTVVAGLSLGLIAVIIGVGIDIYLANTRSTIPSSTRALIQPLNPQLDVETVETLESYETVTIDSARQFVRQLIDDQRAAIIAEEQAVQEALQDLDLVETADDESTGEGQEGGGESGEESAAVSPFLTGDQTETPTEPESPAESTGEETETPGDEQ